MSDKRREPGAREGEVLAALWAADRSLTARDVVEEIGDGLAFNTVQTILTRLHDKGAVSRELVGRTYAYTPLLDEAGLAARRMRSLLDRGGNHDAVLTRFLGTLNADQQRTLARLLRRGDKED